MPRVAGIVVPGQAQHVVQRGDNRQDVFFVDDDRRAYPEFLREHCERFGPASWFYQFNVLGYCLMTHDIRLVGRRLWGIRYGVASPFGPMFGLS